ncbi:hypothetical protein OSTOST_21722, partial [Ostertagia ostertagi]
MAFLLFHIFNYPWSFYPGPLDYIPTDKNSSQIGGCITRRMNGTLYSEILGPPK